MAQKVTVELEDDLTGGPASETVRFAFDGTAHEIDLNTKNAAAFRTALAPYMEHARRAGRVASRGRPYANGGGSPGRSAQARRDSADIRAWAKSQGIAVSERGRIPAEVVDRYMGRANVPAATFTSATTAGPNGSAATSDQEPGRAPKGRKPGRAATRTAATTSGAATATMPKVPEGLNERRAACRKWFKEVKDISIRGIPKTVQMNEFLAAHGVEA